MSAAPLALGTFEVLERGAADGATSMRVRVPGPEHPVFDGHFVGDPLLPAWVQLALVQELATDARGFAAVRFRSAVRPGDELTVRVIGPSFDVATSEGASATGRLVRGDG